MKHADAAPADTHEARVDQLLDVGVSWERIESLVLALALARSGGNVSATAQTLTRKPSQVEHRVKRNDPGDLVDGCHPPKSLCFPFGHAWISMRTASRMPDGGACCQDMPHVQDIAMKTAIYATYSSICPYHSAGSHAARACSSASS